MGDQRDVIVVDGYEEWSSDEQQQQEIKGLGIKCGGNEDGDDKSDCTSLDIEGEEDDIWDDELQSFLEQSPEFRARVQYQVRIVALMPGFQAAGRKLALFNSFYKERFGKSLLEKTGFSSAQMICKSIPHVIQREPLREKAEVVLVDSPKNMRIVAGIRSGLRRVVYDTLRQHPNGLSAQQLDEECSKAIGRSLTMVLKELSYDTPNVECLVRDMADIASFKQSVGVNKYFLSAEAEDPALSDGILLGLRSTAIVKDAIRFGDSNKPLVTISHEQLLQARFRLTVLLALRSGGVALGRLQKAYAEMFSENLDPWLLGFSGIKDLVTSWNDIVLVEDIIPEMVFLRPSDGTYRLLNVLKSGLRMSIFTMLLASYPDGLEPSVVLDQLQESHPSQMLSALSAYGYRAGASEDFDSDSPALHVLCYLVHDMMDYVRFGCRDDGTVVLKLRDVGGFPVLEFPDCDQDDDFVKLLVEAEGAGALTPKIQSLCSSSPENLTLLEENLLEGELVAPIVPVLLEHELRLLLGSPAFLETGLNVEDFSSVYKSRTGRSISLREVKSLVSSRPGILSCKQGLLRLVENPKNLRIVSATKSGLRQVLYWSLLKNPGGVWAEMLDGWFCDFTGFDLTSVFARHGYRGSTSPAADFLEDMADFCTVQQDAEHRIPFYVLLQEEDPLERDARLLGMEAEEIAYDPVKLCGTMIGKKDASTDGEHSEISIDHQEAPATDSSTSWEAEYDPPKAYATPLVAAV